MKDELLINIIRNNRNKFGERNALLYQDDNKNWIPISWNSFWDKIVMTAKSLLVNQIKPYDKVAIMARNCPEWTICDYALQMTRAISVPLFSLTSEAQVQYMLNKTETSLIFVGEQEQYDIVMNVFDEIPSLKQVVVFDSSTNLKGHAVASYFQDFIKPTVSHPSDAVLEELSAQTHKDDICTILFTSGTSGEPKGVMLSIGNFMHCIKIHDMRLSIDDKDVSLCFLPLSHIFERGWTFIALSFGMTNYYLRNPKEVVDAVKVVKPTIMCSVPRFFEKTYEGVNATIAKDSKLKQKIFNWAIKVGGTRLDYIWNRKKVPFNINLAYKIADKLVLAKGRSALGGNFRFMVCGGAALNNDIIHFFEQVGIHIKIGYGLTETVASVTCLLDDDINTKSVGKVMPLLDVKIGENDEILVKGDTVFKGYYKEPELTAAAFEDGYFKTGDAGRLDENGYLYLTDRIKDIFKTSSGKYIAPQKIESLLGNDLYIEQITVIGNERKYITALVVPSAVHFNSIVEKLNLQNLSKEEQVKHPTLNLFFMHRINDLQRDLSPYEQVKKITILPNEFTIQSGELTPSLKIKRKIVALAYQKEIENMYADEQD